jgi:hypothetical protein
MVANNDSKQDKAASAVDDSVAASLKEIVQARRADLEAQLKALSGSNIDSLLLEREAAVYKLREIDGRIAALREELGIPVGKKGRRGAGAIATPGAEPRKRISSEDIRSRVLKALAEARYGMSQKEISDRTLIPYGTVAAYLKANSETFKTTGQLKGKRYFLR